MNHAECGRALGEIFCTHERVTGPRGGLRVKPLDPPVIICSRCDFADDGVGGPPVHPSRIRDPQ